MRKSTKSKNSSVSLSLPSNIIELITMLQEQITGLERKVDTLLSRMPEKSLEVKPLAKPVQTFTQSGQSLLPRQNEVIQNNGFRQRILYKAICSECNKECQLPFKPNGARPVYCKECCAKRKSAVRPLPINTNNKPQLATPVIEPVLANKPQVIEKHRTNEKKKKIAAKKKKK